MKKILAIALALVLVLSMGMVALAEDPAPGTAENPYQVGFPMEAPMELTVPAGTSVWYAFSADSFNGMTLKATAGLSYIAVDGEQFYTRPILQGAIEAPLTAHAMMITVEFANNGEDDVTVALEYAQPTVGTESNKQQLVEGTTEIAMSMDVLNATMGMFYTELYVTWEGGLDLSAISTTEGIVGGFDVLVRYLDENWEEQEVVLTADADGVVAGHVDVPSYTGAIIVIACMDMLETVELTVSGPVLGSEARPIEIYDVTGLEEFTIAAGETLYVNLYSFGQNGNTLYVDGELGVTINGEETKYLVLTNEDYVVSLVLTNENDYALSYPMWVEFPYGTENNPENIWNGETSVVTDGVYTYYYTYVALNDGTLTVKLEDITTVAELSASNTTVLEDPDYDWSDYEKYSDYMERHADKDEDGNTVYDENYRPVYSDPSQYYATVTVNKGDEVTIIVTAKTDEDWEPLPMDAVLTVEGPEAPLGHYENMDEFETGKNEFTVSAEEMTYIGTWIAPADGTITITVTGEVSEFMMGHIETEDPLIMSEGDKLVLDVKKGDEIAFVAVAGMDETTGELVDTDVVLDIDFVEDETDSPATGATGAGVAVLLTLISGAGLAVLNKKRG